MKYIDNTFEFKYNDNTLSLSKEYVYFDTLQLPIITEVELTAVHHRSSWRLMLLQLDRKLLWLRRNYYFVLLLLLVCCHAHLYWLHSHVSTSHVAVLLLSPETIVHHEILVGVHASHHSRVHASHQAGFMPFVLISIPFMPSCWLERVPLLLCLHLISVLLILDAAYLAWPSTTHCCIATWIYPLVWTLLRP